MSSINPIPSKFDVSTLDNNPTPTLIVDHEGRISFINQAARKISQFQNEKSIKIQDFLPNFNHEDFSSLIGSRKIHATPFGENFIDVTICPAEENHYLLYLSGEITRKVSSVASEHFPFQFQAQTPPQDTKGKRKAESISESYTLPTEVSALGLYKDPTSTNYQERLQDTAQAIRNALNQTNLLGIEGIKENLALLKTQIKSLLPENEEIFKQIEALITQASNSILENFGGIEESSKKILQIIEIQTKSSSEIKKPQIEETSETKAVKLTTQKSRSECRALIVDDNIMNLKVLQNLLAKSHISRGNIIQATSGNKAIEIFNNANPPFDIVFLDIEMPDGNGNLALEEMRKKNLEIPIIATTGAAEKASDSFTLKLDKPIKAEKIRSVIDMFFTQDKGSSSGPSEASPFGTSEKDNFKP